MNIELEFLPEPSFIVRFIDNDQIVGILNITEKEDTLYLKGQRGKMLSPSQWKGYLKEHFPKAKYIKFERDNHKVRDHMIKIA